MSLTHIFPMIFSFATLMNLSLRHKIMKLLILSIILVLSVCFMFVDINFSYFSTSAHLCGVNAACILSLHNPKPLSQKKTSWSPIYIPWWTLVNLTLFPNDVHHLLWKLIIWITPRLLVYETKNNDNQNKWPQTKLVNLPHNINKSTRARIK